VATYPKFSSSFGILPPLAGKKDTGFVSWLSGFYSLGLVNEFFSIYESVKAREFQRNLTAVEKYAFDFTPFMERMMKGVPKTATVAQETLRS
jgi:hypothetical protein